MFATQIVLLAATAVAPLASNAAPIFSGMFSKSNLARRAAESNVQLVQGTNFYFTNLRLEDVCQQGQVACISGNFATCSQEANWEITPCEANTSCFAVPNSDNSNVNVQCMAEPDANAAVEAAGGQGGLSVDFQVNNAPFPSPDSPPTGGEGEGEGETPSATEDPNAPVETCVPDDGSEEGEGEGGEGQGEGGEQGGDQNTEPAPEPTPTGDVAEGPTESCPADGPEETETITLILVPNPTAPGTYETSTFTGEFPAATDGTEFTDVPVEAPAPTDVPVEGSEGPVADVPAPSETCTDSEGGSEGGYGEVTGAPVPAPTDAPAEGVDGSEGAPSNTENPNPSPTTLTVNPPAASGPPANGAVNVIGTHQIPAPTGASPAKRWMQKKVRRS